MVGLSAPAVGLSAPAVGLSAPAVGSQAQCRFNSELAGSGKHPDPNRHEANRHEANRHEAKGIEVKGTTTRYVAAFVAGAFAVHAYYGPPDIRYKHRILDLEVEIAQHEAEKQALVATLDVKTAEANECMRKLRNA